MLQGDDGLIRKQHGIIYALALLVIILLLLFNVVQLGNGKDHRYDTRICTYHYKSIVAWSWIRVNEPLLQPDCGYGR